MSKLTMGFSIKKNRFPKLQLGTMMGKHVSVLSHIIETKISVWLVFQTNFNKETLSANMQLESPVTNLVTSQRYNDRLWHLLESFSLNCAFLKC